MIKYLFATFVLLFVFSSIQAQDIRQLTLDESILYGMAIKVLSTMDIFIDGGGFVYYNEMLYAVLKRRHNKNKGHGKLVRKILKRENELSTQKLSRMREKLRSYIENQAGDKVNSNLLISMIYARSTFKAWKKWAALRAKYGSDGNITPGNSSIEFPGENSLDSLTE